MNEERIKAQIEVYRLKAKFLEDLWNEVCNGNGFASYKDVVDWVEKHGYRDKLSIMDLRELQGVIRMLFPMTESTKIICGCISAYLAA